MHQYFFKSKWSINDASLNYYTKEEIGMEKNIIKEFLKFVDNHSSTIDEESRIISVCDFYDAFVSNRSYHGARTPPEGIGALKEEVIGGHFDKRITSKVIKAIKENNIYDFRLETKRVPAGG